MSKDVARIAVGWWNALQPEPDGSRGDKGSLARLRRAANTGDAFGEPAMHVLHARLGGDERDAGRVAAMAAVLAHVRSNDPRHVVARIVASSPPVLSPLRFRRLVSVGQDDDDMMTQFRHLVRIMDGHASVSDLALALYDWTDRVRGPSRRRSWMYRFHSSLHDAAPPAGTA